MARLTTLLLFFVAALTCVQQAKAGEWRARQTAAPLRSLAVVDVNAPVSAIVEETCYAVSNRSVCVVRKSANPTLMKSSVIQLVSGEQNAFHATTMNFASQPIRQANFAGTRTRLSSSIDRARPLAPQNIFQPAPARCEPIVDRVDDVATGQTYVQELQTLEPDVLTAASPEKKSDNYVAELSLLLNGPSPWVLATGAMLDLRPEEPEPVGSSDTYVNELQSLVAGTPLDAATDSRERRDGMLATWRQSQNNQQPGRTFQASPSAKTYLIPQRDPGTCENPGADTVDGLFAPVGVVGVTGTSTAPPEVPKRAKMMELKLPESPACAYLDFDMPGYYFTSGYGVRRAPRNTHHFYNHPLYFEDANLERCGQSNGCLTTLTSAVQFTTMAALLPYQTTADHPRDCVAALPDCPTCHSFGHEAYFPEWSWKAAAVQAAAVTGLVYIIP